MVDIRPVVGLGAERAIPRADSTRVELRVLKQQAPPSDRAPLVPGESGVSPAKGFATTWLRNARQRHHGRTLRPELLRHVVHGLEDRQVAAALAQVRDFERKSPGNWRSIPKL